MKENNQKQSDEERKQETNVHEDRKANVSQEPIDLDYVLTNELGQFGLFQLRNFLLVAVALIMAGTVNEYIFSAAATPHRCRIPECGEHGKLHQFAPDWLKNAVPETGSGFASCTRYAPVDGGINGTLKYCPEDLFDQSTTIPCDGFVYANDNTVVYEFDLGCKEWWRAFAGTMFSIGTFITLPLTGYVSDRYGRRTALAISAFNLALFGLIRAFSVSYTMYLTLQIVQGTLGTGLYTAGYIIATELVGPKYRVITGVTCTSMFCLGEVVLGVVAWLVPPWRHMIMVITIPCFFIVPYYWIISESVRWLLSKKKYAEAEQVLHTVARVNKTHISEKSLEALLNPPQQLTTKSSDKNLGLVRTIIQSPVLLRRVCTTPVWWVTVSFVYYGLSINSASLSDTMHLNYILTTVVGIPGFYMSIFVLGRIGRKATMSCGFFLSAACNISFVFISSDFAIARLIMFLLGKFFIASAGTSLYLYTAELYPTEYRHTLLGFSSMIGRVGSIFAPLTPALMSYYHGLPSLLFGGMGILSGLLVLTQPETLGCRMPDTLAEAEAIGKPESRIKHCLQCFFEIRS